jgi:hypothetical protein
VRVYAVDQHWFALVGSFLGQHGDAQILMATGPPPLDIISA